VGRAGPSAAIPLGGLDAAVNDRSIAAAASVVRACVVLVSVVYPAPGIGRAAARPILSSAGSFVAGRSLAITGFSPSAPVKVCSSVACCIVSAAGVPFFLVKVFATVAKVFFSPASVASKPVHAVDSRASLQGDFRHPP
jgi:hypothetical protein